MSTAGGEIKNIFETLLADCRDVRYHVGDGDGDLYSLEGQQSF